jgi:hypothetical protein
MTNPMSAQEQRDQMQRQAQGQTGYGSGSDDFVKPGQTGNNENGASQGQHAAEDANQSELTQPGYGSTGQAGMGSVDGGGDTLTQMDQSRGGPPQATHGEPGAMSPHQSGGGSYGQASGMNDDPNSGAAIGGGMGGAQSNSDPQMQDDDAMIDDEADGANAASAGGGM